MPFVLGRNWHGCGDMVWKDENPPYHVSSSSFPVSPKDHDPLEFSIGLPNKFAFL